MSRRHWQRAVDDAPVGGEYSEWWNVFAPGGRAPRPGERWRNPDAARSLRLIAETGSEAFYRGEIASALAEFAAATGGPLTGDDLARHTSTWVDAGGRPVPRARGLGDPAQRQGLAALLALQVLEGFEPGGGDWPHRQVEAMKLGFADAHAYVADPDHAPAPVAALLDPAYARARRPLIGERAAVPVAGEPAGAARCTCAPPTRAG